MNFIKNRTILGIICIAISLVICFLVTPLFNAGTAKTTEIVRMKADVKIGEAITKNDIETLEVGAYNMPENVLKSADDAVGKYVTSELLAGEYILSTKVSDTPAAENEYLYSLNGEKRAISVTIQSFAGGLSGKLQSGDIVSIIASDFQGTGETVVPDELQYVEVIAVTDKKGYDTDEETQTDVDAEEDDKDLPSTITLLVTPEQANLLVQLEADGDIHVSLVYRGTKEKSAEFIAEQEKLISESAEKETATEEIKPADEIPAETTAENTSSETEAQTNE